MNKRSFHWVSLLVFVCALASYAGGAEPAPSTREAAKKAAPLGTSPGDMYKPEDGAEAIFNPPSLAWPVGDGDGTYSIQIGADRDFSKPIVSVEKIVWNAYTHSEPLAAGTYFWRVKGSGFWRIQGAGNWGAVNSFIIRTETPVFPCPTRAEQRNLVPKDHPRLFMRPESVQQLRQWAKEDGSQVFAKVLAKTDDATSQPTQVNEKQAPDKAEALAFAYLISGQQKYADEARRILLQTAAGKTFPEHFYRVYDWIYPVLSEADRATVRDVIAKRMAAAWGNYPLQRGRDLGPVGWTGNLNAVEDLAEGAVAFYGEVPNTDKYLDFAVNKFFACYPGWGDEEGEKGDGVVFWATYMSGAHQTLRLMQTSLGIEGVKKPYFTGLFDYLLYTLPPGSPNLKWVDYGPVRVSVAPRNEPSGGLSYRYLLGALNKALPQTGNRGYWNWWYRTWQFQAESPAGVFECLNENLGTLPEPKAPADLPQSRFFPITGVAALNTNLSSSAENVQLLFKSNPRGNYNHAIASHKNHQINTYHLVAYGDAIFPTQNFRDDDAVPWTCWRKESDECAGQNYVSVNDRGPIRYWIQGYLLQSLKIEGSLRNIPALDTPVQNAAGQAPTAAPDQLPPPQLTPAVDYVCGENSGVYEGELTRFRRHVVFVKPELIVMYDDLVAPVPSTFQWRIVSWKQFTMDDKSMRLSVEREHGGADLQYLSPVPLSMRQWNGYNVPSDSIPLKIASAQCPKFWHVEAGTQEKKERLEMITVIAPYRIGAKKEWTAERIESDTAVGVKVRRGGKTTLVAFKKVGVPEANLGGASFKETFVVR